VLDRLPEFEAPPKWDYYKHKAWGFLEQAPLTCRHLVNHDCFNGKR